MTINEDPKTCDFCARDPGLTILVTRYTVSTRKAYYADNTTSESETEFYDEFDQRLQDLNGVKRSYKNYIAMENHSNDSSREKNNQLPTIELDAQYTRYFNSIKGVPASEGYSYALSLLRKGYLYVYMPHIKKWFEYAISEQGFLNRIDNNNFFSETENFQDGKEPCFKNRDRAKALTITIPKAEQATEIYIKFSEVKWSKNKKTQNKSKYKKNMNKFDINAYLSGENINNQFPINSNNLNLVKSFSLEEYEYLEHDKSRIYLQSPWTKNNITAKYTGSYEAIKNYFDLQHADYSMENPVDSDGNSIQKFDEYTLEELQEYFSNDKNIRKFTGAIFCLDDDVGLVQDIGSNALAILEDNTVYTPQEKTLIDIEGLKYAFGINDDPYYTLEEEKKRDEKPVFIDPMLGWGYENQLGIEEERRKKKTPEQLAEEELKSKERFIKRKKDEWKEKYESCLDGHLLLNATITKRAKDLIKANKLDNLDQWALKIFENEFINKHYFFITERDNADSLYDNYELSSSIIEFIKSLPRCLDYLAQALYIFKSEKSFIADSLCCSSTDIAKGMASYINYANLSTVPWGDLLSRVYAVSASLSDLENARLQSSISQFILHLAPIAFRGIQIKPQNLSPLAIMIGGHAQAVVKDGKIRAKSVTEFNNKLTDLFMAYYKDTFGGDVKIKRDSMLRRVANDPIWDKARKSLFISIPFLDLNTLSLPRDKDNFVKTLSSVMSNTYQVAPEAPSSTEISKLNVDVNIPESVLLNKGVAFQQMVATGNFVFQSLAMITVWGDTNYKGSEKGGRRAASLAGVVMAATEGTALLLSKYLERKMAVGPLQNTRLIRFSKELVRVTDIKHLGWRFLGATVGFVFGIFDLINGYKAIKSGEKTYGTLLSLSGGAMVVSSVFILVGLAMHPIGLLFLALSIGFAIYALYKREKALQIWMRKSFLGKRENGMVGFNRYENQLTELNGILK